MIDFNRNTFFKLKQTDTDKGARLVAELLTDGEIDYIFDFIGQNECIADDPKALSRIEIAAEEIFVNIAHYAYPDSEGDAVIETEVTTDPPAIAITFRDSGEPYDPLAKEDPDITLSAEKRRIGGLGIFLVKKLMDEVAYKYEDGQNVLTIIKLLDK